jgi:hypothetical protein
MSRLAIVVVRFWLRRMHNRLRQSEMTEWNERQEMERSGQIVFFSRDKACSKSDNMTGGG